MKLTIAKNKLTSAATLAPTPEKDKKTLNTYISLFSNKTSVPVDLDRIPTSMLKFMLTNGYLTEGQAQKVGIYLKSKMGGSLEEVENFSISSASQFQDVFQTILAAQKGQFNLEYNVNNRWYPVKATSSSYNSKVFGVFVHICFNVMFVDIGDRYDVYVDDWMFEKDQKKITLTIKEILERNHLRLIRTDELEYQRKSEKARRMGANHGEVVDVTGSVIVHEQFGWWNRLEIYKFGTPTRPRRVIIENELETADQDRHHRAYNNQVENTLPYVRCFSLDEKRYVYVDVDDLAPHTYERDVVNNLILPGSIKKTLDEVFKSDVDNLFGDFLSFKSGGLVVLASGSPGIGKTFTAEAYAEAMGRPLYVLEASELGTEVERLEESLKLIFKRASRWNAILLLDEADVFMATRGLDLERNAIVGIFLRMLDYYKGILFLTTNRTDIIDPAFKSRITLHLNYPDLTSDTRMTIWSGMLTKAGLTVTGNMRELAEEDVNGRQIRNITRLAKIHAKDGTISVSDIKELCKFSCK